MCIYSFSIKKVFWLLILLISFTGCFRINHNTYLKLKDGNYMSLYHHDSAWLEIWGRMKEWNDYVFDNNNRLNDSNYVNFSIRVKDFDTIFINKFTAKIWW